MKKQQLISTLTFRSFCTNQSGFTLLEVLISITILAFITFAIVAIQDNGLTVKETVIAEDRDWLQVETAFARFEWDFSHIFSPLYYSHALKVDQLETEEEQEAYAILTTPYASNENFAFPSYDSHPVPIFKFENKNTFEFFTTSNRRKFKNSKQSNYAWVKYSVENFEDKDGENKTKALVRYFYPDDPFSVESIQWDKIKGQILLRNVEKLTFQFWDYNQRKWFDDLDLVIDGRHKVNAVKIYLEWLDKENNKLTYERIFRPLFLHFNPEDMYKLMKKTSSNPQPNPDGNN